MLKMDDVASQRLGRVALCIQIDVYGERTPHTVLMWHDQRTTEWFVVQIQVRMAAAQSGTVPDDLTRLTKRGRPRRPTHARGKRCQTLRTASLSYGNCRVMMKQGSQIVWSALLLGLIFSFWTASSFAASDTPAVLSPTVFQSADTPRDYVTGTNASNISIFPVKKRTAHEVSQSN